MQDAVRHNNFAGDPYVIEQKPRSVLCAPLINQGQIRGVLYLENNRERFTEELFEFLRIPSVSARSEHKGDTRRAAEWLEARMREIGLQTQIHDTPGHPIVTGEWRGAGESAPTLLIYGHYDVQPAEPLELWTSPPFEPTVRDGRVYARGSVDDKGQMFLHVCAAEAHLKTRGALPVNVVFLVEGEDDAGLVKTNLDVDFDQPAPVARIAATCSSVAPAAIQRSMILASSGESGSPASGGGILSEGSADVMRRPAAFARIVIYRDFEINFDCGMELIHSRTSIISAIQI